MKNIELAYKIIQELIDTGIREFVLCAGARNSPFIFVLNECKEVKIYNYFEERSGAFFALGRIALTRRPVAIITTSGTAVAEILPAAIEGTYSSLPLIIVTADRPRKYRGSGAPQTIDQVGLFSYYTEVTLDIDEENSHVSFKNLSWKKPVHVNVCFEEPLIDAPIAKLVVPEVTERTRLADKMPRNIFSDMNEFLKTHRPVVLLGYLPEKAHASILNFLERYQAPVYAEGISGLRGHPQIEKLLIKSGEKMISRMVDQGICNAVLRIGSIPTLRFWRDLEEKHSRLPVLSVSYNHYTGLSRPVNHFCGLEVFRELQFEPSPPLHPDIAIADYEKFQQMQALFRKYPQAEPSLVQALSLKLKNKSVYLGNSLPIREWDLAADYDSAPQRVAANRGANGIDGQISSFLGWCHSNAENWCLIGDLTAMYDLSALAVVPQLENMKIRIVIINNKGGQIFKNMFKKDIFINKHSISFNHWAAMWNWNYNSWIKIPEMLDLADHQIIELLPDADQSDVFSKELEDLWKK